jgi:hypothetical protein
VIPTLNSCTFTDCHSTSSYGAIVVDLSTFSETPTLHITGSVFDSLTGFDGGALTYAYFILSYYIILCYIV